MSGYPSEWEADVVLADGGTVHVRPISPDDADRLRAFHSRLSPESVYFRFFSPRPTLTDREVTRFTTVDYDERMALIALLGDDMVGVARYDRWPGKDEAEVAFTIEDGHHGRGIATVLLEHLAVAARQRGIHTFTAEVLPENRKMLGVFRSAGFKLTTAFHEGVIDVRFGIDPTEGSVSAMQDRERVAEARSVARLLMPRSIAVVGAGRRPGTLGREVFANLLRWGFGGPVYPVNRDARHVASVRAWPTVTDVPDDVDVVVVSVPADEVPAVVEQAALKQVKGLIVTSAGFADAGPEGVAAQRRLVELARRHGMRLIGPASLGVVNTAPSVSMVATSAAVNVLPGRVALLVGQSGPLGVAILRRAREVGLGISAFVSVGNKADVSTNDVLQYWEDDERTNVVLLYVTESFGNPRKFSRIARRVSRAKPVVVVRAGAPGGDADPNLDALFRQAGVIRVDDVEDLFDVARLLDTQPLPAGRRVAVVTNAPNPATLARGACDRAGLPLAELGETTVAELATVLQLQVEATNPVVLPWTAGGGEYETVLRLLLADRNVDAAMVLFTPSVNWGESERVARAIAGVSSERNDKPVVATFLAADPRPATTPGVGRIVPAFEFPDNAARALARVVDYAEWVRRPVGVVPDLAHCDHDAARAIVEEALALRPAGVELPWDRACTLLGTYGVAVAPGRVVRNVDEAVAAAEEVGWPVTLKATGLERLARSERGGVALDVQDPAEMRATYERMVAALGDSMAQALVQRMAPPGVEVLIEVRQDPLFGPVIGLGLGGAYADAISDTHHRLLPLTDLDAADLISSTRAATVLFGPEGQARADVGRLEDLLLRIARLADDVPEVRAVRLNPVLVSAEDAVPVDVKVRVGPVPVGPVPEGVRRLE